VDFSGSINGVGYKASMEIPVTATEIINRTAEVVKQTKLTVLEEAALLVNDGGDRNDSYDHPYPNFSKIAKTWEVVLGCTVTPRQVALCMIGMKLVRESHKAKRDNIVDIIGYARCIERLEEWVEREATR
jgi:hypothetical protein